LNSKIKNENYKNILKENIAAWMFLLPFLVFYIGFLLFPILRGFYVSLFDSTLGKMDTVFVGFQNYIRIFTDKHFWEALFNTAFFVLISTPVIAMLGFIFAILINLKLKGTTFIRVAYFSSYVLSMSVVTGLWIFIYQPYTGLLSNIAASIGANELFWLNTRWLVWIAVLITTAWWTVGFNMVLFLAGLQNIPEEIYQAASIDGANRAQTLFKVTIPMLKETIALVILLQMIASFKLFGQTYLMAGGGPGTHTRTLVHYIYETGFTNRKMGLASAMSVALLAVILLFSLIQNKIFATKDEG